MKKILNFKLKILPIKVVILLTVFQSLSYFANAQVIDVEIRNQLIISCTQFSFEIWERGGSGYVTQTAPWNNPANMEPNGAFTGQTLRYDFTFSDPLITSIVSTTSTKVAGLTTSGGSVTQAPAAGATAAIGVTFGRPSDNSLPDLSTTVFTKYTTITVNVNAGCLAASDINAPRSATTAGSKWSNAAAGTTRSINSSPTTLPIKLVKFEASKSGSSVKLNWLTSSEINAKGYDVERSGNGIDFTAIANVPAVGSSNYSSTDASPLSGVNYYRLKMVDNDGKFKYSDVRTVLFDGSAVLFDIYPNPVVTNKLYLHLQQNNYVGKAQAIITDIAGRSVQSININVVKGNNQMPISVNGLSTGTYFVTIYDASGVSITESKKLVKQ